MIPGSNLLNRAARLIQLQDVAWSAWLSNTKVAGGVVKPTYANPVTVQASVQAVSRAMYNLFGLDLQKNYVMLYTKTPMRDLERNGSCDLVDFNGRRFNVQSNTDWYGVDGWRGAICVDVGATPP